MEENISSIIVVGSGSNLDVCEYYAFLMSRLDISVEEDLHGG